MQLESSQIIFISEIKKQIKAAQYRALQKVNAEQVMLYWNIGKAIVERQQEFGWGKSIVELLAIELQKEFVGIQGFSARNLWRMRTLYEEYHVSDLILPPLVAEIPWTHNILIIEKCKDEHERFFYINRTKKFSWSKTMLINAIDAQHYQKTILNQTNFDTTLALEEANDANFIVKDEYLFDFLNLSEPHSESQLEQAILTNIRNFLTALGGDFSFIGNQFSVKVENKNYEVDLLLFHRELQCLVAIDLKIDEFNPDFAGKMNFYLSILNSKVKKEHERPSIGIIICKSKNRTIVEFALQDVNKPIGVATYSTSPNLPVDMQQFFPTNEEFVEKVESITQYINEKSPKF
ncbi:PDDEXK nuclease domain-containing protein [Flavobacterium praedii]|uniref:PDDEXK nuclease domain-containing protein n=1 Tax=Flavobacterium praedii TaxID=3002900 RepID=UPI002481C6D4|nr:PDDEXK nuclease domain-containing protein [Flavobacterium praedii]